MFQQLDLDRQVHDGTYKRYLVAERAHLHSLKVEPLEEQSRFHYVGCLQKFWVARTTWEDLATVAGVNHRYTVLPTEPLPKKLREALMAYNTAHAECEHFEHILGITPRWEPDSPEYAKAKKWSEERKYRMALDRLERLVIQRLFELQKANLVSMGKS